MPLASTQRSEGVASRKGSFGGASEVLEGESLVPEASGSSISPCLPPMCATTLCALCCFAGIWKLAGYIQNMCVLMHEMYFQHLCIFCWLQLRRRCRVSGPCFARCTEHRLLARSRNSQRWCHGSTRHGGSIFRVRVYHLICHPLAHVAGKDTPRVQKKKKGVLHYCVTTHSCSLHTSWRCWLYDTPRTLS